MGTPWRPRGPDDLDDDQRARIRRRVLQGQFRPYRPTFSDRVYDAFALLAVPAPHIVRAIVSAAVIVSIIGTATVASADALPDEPLYAMKLAGEQVRLAMARTPQDRAAVELSMAEHRLSEAERLALEGREPDALIATSAYGAHLANAAAELATIERLEIASKPVVDQLKQRLQEQQQRAADVAAHLVADPLTAASAALFRTVASFAPALPSGATISEGIAEHASNVADRIAAAAERLASGIPEGETEADETMDEDRDEEGVAVPEAQMSGSAISPAGPPAAARAEPARAAPQQTPRSAPTARPTAAPRASAAIGSTGATLRAEPTKTPAPRATSRATPRPTAKATSTPDPKKASEARAAADKAKAEAEKARSAAEKAKQAAKKTASPRPAPTPRR